jgi:hypothetical protein
LPGSQPGLPINHACFGTRRLRSDAGRKPRTQPKPLRWPRCCLGVSGPRLRNRRPPRRDTVGIRRSQLGTALDIMSPGGGARDPGVVSPSAYLNPTLNCRRINSVSCTTAYGQTRRRSGSGADPRPGEVGIAAAPDHIIHFDGPKFLRPHDPQPSGPGCDGSGGKRGRKSMRSRPGPARSVRSIGRSGRAGGRRPGRGRAQKRKARRSARPPAASDIVRSAPTGSDLGLMSR